METKNGNIYCTRLKSNFMVWDVHSKLTVLQSHQLRPTRYCLSSIVLTIRATLRNADYSPKLANSLLQPTILVKEKLLNKEQYFMNFSTKLISRYCWNIIRNLFFRPAIHNQTHFSNLNKHNILSSNFCLQTFYIDQFYVMFGVSHWFFF